MPRLDAPLDAACLADPERGGRGVGRGGETPDHPTVEMQSTGEREVALQHGAAGDQGVDLSGDGRLASREHRVS